MWRNITAVAFQPGARIVAIGRKDTTLTLMDGTAEHSLGVLHGHSGVKVKGAVWTGDGKVLLSGGEDGEIPASGHLEGRPLAVLRVVEGTTSSYVFTEGPDPRIEVFGDEAARFPVCRVGRETLPFVACAERFGARGLLAAVLAGSGLLRRPR